MISEIATPGNDKTPPSMSMGSDGRTTSMCPESWTGVEITNLKFNNIMQISRRIEIANVTSGGLNKS